MFLRLKLYVVFLLAKIAEKIADCVSFEEIIVCYLSFLLYIMILWLSSFFLECILFEAQNLSFCTQFFINFSVDSQVFGILDI